MENKEPRRESMSDLLRNMFGETNEISLKDEFRDDALLSGVRCSRFVYYPESSRSRLSLAYDMIAIYQEFNQGGPEYVRLILPDQEHVALRKIVEKLLDGVKAEEDNVVDYINRRLTEEGVTDKNERAIISLGLEGAVNKVPEMKLVWNLLSHLDENDQKEFYEFFEDK